MKFILSFIMLCIMAIMAYANGKDIAKSLGLDPSSKAIKQWERVFKKDRKMKKYSIDKLSKAEKEDLKKYLTDHAADSDHPEAAGI